MEETLTVQTFTSFKDARQNMLGSGDNFRYYNPKTGRPIKKLSKYLEVVLYGENERMGYKSLTWLKKNPITKEVFVRKELFDQNGDIKSFNELWEAFSFYTDFQR